MIGLPRGVETMTIY